jgi:hypothetical protein
LANARPDAVFNYCSKLRAGGAFVNAIAVLIRHGRSLEVCGTSSALCFASRAFKFSVMRFSAVFGGAE